MKRGQSIVIELIFVGIIGLCYSGLYGQTPYKSEWFEKVEKSIPKNRILNALQNDSSAIVSQGKLITFAIKTQADSVMLMSPFRTAMSELTNDVWVASYHLNAIDSSMISWSYVTYHGDDVRRGYGPRWRGSLSQELFHIPETTEGRIFESELFSKVLGETRAVSVYLPPNHNKTTNYPILYTVDGSETGNLMKRVDALIVSGRLKPMLIVGAHTSGYLDEIKPDFSNYNPLKDIRSREYNKGFLAYIGLGDTDTLFVNHMTFFTEELSDWAEKNFGASSNRQDKVVSGASNGGSFVASLSTDLPTFYGCAVLNSISWEKSVETIVGKVSDFPRFYFAAGYYEPSFLENTEEIANKLSAYGANVKMTKTLAAHDDFMWDEETIKSLLDCFGRR